MREPKQPENSAPKEEWLAYWISLLEWLRKEREALTAKIKARRKAISKTRKKIAELERAIKEAQAIDWSGHSSNVDPKIKEVARAAIAHGLYVTSTTGGTHSPTSWHYSGHAIDVAGDYSAMIAFQKFACKQWPNALEVFGPANSPWIKNGQVISGAEGSALENLHDNHVHVAR